MQKQGNADPHVSNMKRQLHEAPVHCHSNEAMAQNQGEKPSAFHICTSKAFRDSELDGPRLAFSNS